MYMQMLQRRALLLATCVLVVSSSPSCISEDGSSVDWWFAYKLPKAASDAFGGLRYAYLDSKRNQTMQLSSKSVQDSTSILGQTLARVYSGDVSYVFVSDQHPNGDWSEVYAHSKGTLAFDSAGGYFIQHSIPKFPNYKADGYAYGDSQSLYGQHALCMTMNLTDLDKVAYAMRVANAWEYDHAIVRGGSPPPSLSNVTAFLNNESFYGRSVTFDAAIEANSARLFAMSPDVNEDVVETLVGCGLAGASSIRYQSWLNSATPLGAVCKMPRCANVTDIDDKLLPSSVSSDTQAWPTRQDHSKWAVADGKGDRPWARVFKVCGLDNNHVVSQMKRGGLALCFQHKALNSALRTTIENYVDSCSGKDPVKSGKCASYGCDLPYNATLECQCSADCEKYGNCCDDFASVCKKSSVGFRP